MSEPGSVEVTCQYQPDSGRSNRLSAMLALSNSLPRRSSSTTASSPSRVERSRASKLRSTAARNSDDRRTPVMASMTMLQPADETISRKASESRRIVGFSHAVPQSAHGLDGVGAELLAQPADEHLHRVGVAVEVLVVQVFDKLRARDHPPLVVHQVGEQPIFERCQLDGVAVNGDAGALCAEPQVAALDLR